MKLGTFLFARFYKILKRMRLKPTAAAALFVTVG
jgi:hypothetical protein